jgi:hypothetical protein
MMKKYLNGTRKCLCLELETHAQFLFTGQSVTTDETPKSIPEGIIVVDVEPEPAAAVAPKKKVVRKKSVSKKSED